MLTEAARILIVQIVIKLIQVEISGPSMLSQSFMSQIMLDVGFTNTEKARSYKVFTFFLIMRLPNHNLRLILFQMRS